MAVYLAKELDEIYEECTSVARAQCVLTTELVGGQPAGDEALRAFCEHHLKLTGDELEQAVARIKSEEIGEKDVTPEGGELKDKLTYGVNCLRRDPDGCAWLGNWMVKACLKGAASRLGIFQKKAGSKGDLAEMGRILAYGASLGPEPRHIRLLNPDGTPYTERLFRKYSGSVNGPSGRKSIQHDSETVPVGIMFEWELRFGAKKLTEDDVAKICALAQEIGLGSAKALDRGRFRIERLEIHMQ